jgi:hypothetical protein
MSRKIAPLGAVLGAIALSACATRAPVPAEIESPPPHIAVPPPAPPPAPAAPKVVRVIVPKPVKCVPDDLGPPPTYPDNDTALRDAGGAADRYQLLAAGRILREQRLQKLEDVVRHCRNVGR